MTITKDTVVTLNYILKNAQGEVMEESGDEPLIYLHGHKNIVPGLEQALEGLAIGASTQATIAPADGYGELDPELKFSMPIDKMGGDIPPMDSIVSLKNKDGRVFMAQVVGLDDKTITFDANHPLAGETLNFQVTIMDVREALADEVAHGHVHGEGCHHHH